MAAAPSPASLLRLGALAGFFGIWENRLAHRLVDPLSPRARP